MSNPATELHPCACGCGEMVSKTYARGHWARVNRGVPRRPPRALPDPDIEDEELDEVIDLGPEDDEDFPMPAPRPVRAVVTDEDDSEPVSDPEPAHLGGKREKGREKGKPVRVTVTIRKDITAKIRAVTYPGARMWAMRDPYCGPVAVQQEPEIASALSDIVCDSPDLVAWFTGPAGGFMKFFSLFMACLPVATMAYGHHWKRPEGEQGDPLQAPDYSQYAA